MPKRPGRPHVRDGTPRVEDVAVRLCTVGDSRLVPGKHRRAMKQLRADGFLATEPHLLPLRRTGAAVYRHLHEIAGVRAPEGEALVAQATALPAVTGLHHRTRPGGGRLP